MQRLLNNRKWKFLIIFLFLLSYISLGASLPDLTITEISYNPSAGDFLFANEPNSISVKVKNNGDMAATPFSIKLDVGSYTKTKLRTSNLDAGSTTTITFTGYSPFEIGGVNVIVTVDSSNEVTESDEDNNIVETNPVVYYNGNKGKRFTNGNDINTHFGPIEGHIDLVYSAGNSAYNNLGWGEKTYSWSSTDLPIPIGATVTSARLYQGYTWDETPGGSPIWTMTFNGETITPLVTYTDRKGYSTSFDLPQGLYVYDVTSQFDTAGNSMTITPLAGNQNGIYGAYLIVIYEDAGKSLKKIWVNDEMDILYAGSVRSVSSEEATAYANFAGVSTTDIVNAEAIAILQSASDSGKSKFFFNSQEYTGFWSGYLSSPQIGFSVYDVTSALTSGENVARVQSYDSGSGGDNMYATNVILIVEKQETVQAPVAEFTANPTSGTTPLAVTFTDKSTNLPTSWTWEYQTDAGDWTQFSVEQNPEYSFAVAGSYDIRLTATNAGGSDDETKTGYIMVNEPVGPPVAAFTGNPVSGTVPLIVQFTDESTGEISSYAWDFDNDGTTDSIDQNPDHTYTIAGTYTVKLTVTGPGGSDEEIKTGFITANDESSIEVSVSPTGISFGAMSAAVPSTATTTVSVTTTGTHSWSVTASDQKPSYKGYMTTIADLALENPLELSNDASSWHELSADFSDFILGSGAGSVTETAGMRQAVSAGDPPGDYSITITFTGVLS